MLTFTEICEGNPGCLAFVEQAYMSGELHEAFEAESAFSRVVKAGIRGSRLYMLWNDCCNRDTKRAIKIMLTKPIEDIIHHIDDGKGYGIPYEADEEEVNKCVHEISTQDFIVIDKKNK